MRSRSTSFPAQYAAQHFHSTCLSTTFPAHAVPAQRAEPAGLGELHAADARRNVAHGPACDISGHPLAIGRFAEDIAPPGMTTLDARIFPPLIRTEETT
ncbi:MAG: hypothetical protein DI547_06230 [Sphingobium sp.]|jgi:hypothetical protein|nr:MAG: hypothetical protein DI547_06230 [Sphingobium sp.]